MKTSDDLHRNLEKLLPELRAYVRLRTGPSLRARETSNDLVQSVCREILQRADRFEPKDEAAFRHWLFETAFRKLHDRARYWHAARRDPARERDGRASQLGDQELLACYQRFSSPSGHAVAHERLEQIEDAFARLPESYREVILLTKIVGLAHAEVAERLGKQPATVRMLLSRALARLSTLLDTQAD